MGRNSKFSAEYKLKIIDDIKNTGVKTVAERYDIHESTLRIWQIQYKYQGVNTDSNGSWHGSMSKPP